MRMSENLLMFSSKIYTDRPLRVYSKNLLDAYLAKAGLKLYIFRQRTALNTKIIEVDFLHKTIKARSRKCGLNSGYT